MDTKQLASGSPPPPLRAGPLRFLLGTKMGLLLLALLVLRFVRPWGLLPEAIDRWVDIGLVIYAIGYAIGFAIRGLSALRSRLLWRIRRKLIISYLLIGLLPTVLILFFFLLSAYLVFGQVSAYILSASLAKTGSAAARAADLATADLSRSETDQAAVAEIERILSKRLEPLTPLYPGTSAAYFGRQGSGAYTLVGKASDLAVSPQNGERLPEWASQGYQGLLLMGDQYFVAGLSQPQPNGTDFRVLVTIPIESALRRVEEETGLEAQEVLSSTGDPGTISVDLPSPSDLDLLTASPNDSSFSLRWAALVETRQWHKEPTGESSPEPLGIILLRFSLSDIYRVVATNTLQLGRAILVLLGILAALFLAIEVLAVFVGLVLARSITGSIHALSQATDHVRKGDFGHKVRVRSRDQLGELAGSFNLMTASIQDLLKQSAEKERLEEELRIARKIQMSLLPKGEVELPGLTVAALCLPATEVGGDYYDFISLDDKRLALLIADVSGKGTSAALYMAVLKGLILSLSKIYQSPRQLLIDANKILSAHMDSRSFITMSYAVIDMGKRTMTYARAGHNPILHLSRHGQGTRALAPDGLGLALDRSGRFEQILAEESVTLEPGDLFLFFTDGLSEAMNPHADLFGESRLREVLERHGELPLLDLRERIIDEIFTFMEGEDQHDDMTMVLLRVT